MRFGIFAKATAAAAIVFSGAVSAAAVSPGTAEAAGVWDRLARCESGGNWAINTGNGYYGGLQFSRSTWAAYGGEQFHRYPHRATREQQIAIAEVVRAASDGFGAWPACARKLGLPR